MTRDVLSSRESVRTDVHMLEVVWLSSAGLVRLGIPTPANFTGREKWVQKSGGVVVRVVPPKSAKRKQVWMSVSIGAK